MNKNEKIYSPSVSVLINLGLLIGGPLFWWFFMDLSINGLGPENARKLAQVGIMVNMISALFMVIRYLWQGRYSRRLQQLFKLDEELDVYVSLLKYDEYSEDEVRRNNAEVAARREAHYKDLIKILALDKIEHIHMYLGVCGLLVGSLMQMVAAGVTS